MGYITHMQQVSAGNQFDGTAPTGAKSSGNGKFIWAEGAAGGLFDISPTGPGHIMGVQLYGEGATVLAGKKALGALTLGGNAANTETVTINGKVYTFQTVLTDVDGNVKIGGSASASIDNLIAAINGDAGAGTTYAALMTTNVGVTAAAGAGDTMIATAILGGTVGNAITTTETLGAAGSAWGAATLAAGANDAAYTVSKVTAEGDVVELFTGTGVSQLVTNSAQRIPMLPGEDVKVVTTGMTGAMRCMVMTDYDITGGTDG